MRRLAALALAALGASLLVDAVRRANQAAVSVGARALVTEAIDDDAIRFYEHHGMARLIEGSHLLFVPLRGEALYSE